MPVSSTARLRHRLHVSWMRWRRRHGPAISLGRCLWWQLNCHICWLTRASLPVQHEHLSGRCVWVCVRSRCMGRCIIMCRSCACLRVCVCVCTCVYGYECAPGRAPSETMPRGRQSDPGRGPRHYSDIASAWHSLCLHARILISKKIRIPRRSHKSNWGKIASLTIGQWPLAGVKLPH